MRLTGKENQNENMKINVTNNNNYNSFNPSKKPYFGLNSNSSRGKDVS